MHCTMTVFQLAKGQEGHSICKKMLLHQIQQFSTKAGPSKTNDRIASWSNKSNSSCGSSESSNHLFTCDATVPNPIAKHRLSKQ